MEYATLGLRRGDSWLYKFWSSIQIECDITAFLDNSNDEEKKMGRKVEKKQTINFSKALRLLIQSNIFLPYSITAIVPFTLTCVLFIFLQI